MTNKFERAPQSASEPAYVKDKPDDTPGLRGERIVGEFIQDGFNNILTKIERTSQYDENDKNGVDYVIGVAGDGRFAMDITFDKDERRDLKRKRFLQDPCVALHDENKKAISEPLPRLLIDGGRSMELWFLYEEEAKRRGLKLIDSMPEKDKKDKIGYFLNQIVSQIIGMSRRDKDYAKRAKPAKEIFEAEAKRLGVSY